MQFCQDHWDKLRDAVDAEGLGDQVSTNTEIVTIRTMAQLQGSKDPDMFDPLMFAMWNLIVNGSRLVGAQLVACEGCPLCWILAEHALTCNGDPRCTTVKQVTEEWPVNAASAARLKYEELK